jgi:hypothetical protein
MRRRHPVFSRTLKDLAPRACGPGPLDQAYDSAASVRGTLKHPVANGSDALRRDDATIKSKRSAGAMQRVCSFVVGRPGFVGSPPGEGVALPERGLCGGVTQHMNKPSRALSLALSSVTLCVLPELTTWCRVAPHWLRGCGRTAIDWSSWEFSSKLATVSARSHDRVVVSDAELSEVSDNWTSRTALAVEGRDGEQTRFVETQT